MSPTELELVDKSLIDGKRLDAAGALPYHKDIVYE